MDKWQDYFKIEEDWGNDDPNDINSFRYQPDCYKLIIIASGQVVGTYKDYKYAKKQAEYKFKRILSKVEKILLS